MKKNNSNISIIVPLNNYNEEIEKYLKRGFDTIDKNFSVIVIGDSDTVSKAKTFITNNFKELKVKYIKNKNTNFAEQINKATLECDTEYFVVLEFDDMFTDIFNDVMQVEIKDDSKSIIIPFNEYVSPDEVFLSFGNEIAWDAAYSDDMLGHLSIEGLKTYKDFNVTGALIKTEDYIEVGGLKENMDIAMWYEFLLRSIHYGKNVYVTPRVCYRHTILRKESFFEQSKKRLTSNDVVKLIDKALEDYTNK